MSNTTSSASGPTLVPKAPAPDLVFVSPGDFDAQFRLVPTDAYIPSADVKAFLDCVNGCVEALAAARLLHRADESPELRDEACEGRDNLVKRLRKEAEAVAAEPAGLARDVQARARMAECWRIEGVFREYIRRLDTTPFVVEPAMRDATSQLIADLRIRTRDTLIPDMSSKLKTELDSAVLVTRAVFAERERGAWRKAKINIARQRLSEYLAQLSGIAKVGLMSTDPTQTAFARADLQRYRAEFTIREAGAVKNRYVRRLGRACLLVAIPATIAYSLARDNPEWVLAYTYRNFFLLAAGTAVGTWLSFSLRRVMLTFDDLAVLEEDRLDPGLRVLFMIGLVTVVGLLFWTGAVSFGIGPLLSQEAMQNRGAWALLIGLLAGIAERVLGTAVSRRAADFAVSVGGSAGPLGGQSQTVAK